MQAIPSSWVIPDWLAPANVRAVSTSREGGCSCGPYASFNLGDHVNDDFSRVTANRKTLREILSLPAEPIWLNQVHACQVVDAAAVSSERVVADASFAQQPGTVCTVMTADCLPVLFCDAGGTRVAVAHAGWRGLAAGVLESTIDALNCDTQEILAWLGPAIGPDNFEVGDAVRTVFLGQSAIDESAFVNSDRGRWLADIYELARNRLYSKGVSRIFGGDWCTYSDPKRFYSYRRDKTTGRMASLIWLMT